MAMKGILCSALCLSAVVLFAGCTSSGYEPIPTNSVLRDVLADRGAGLSSSEKRGSLPAGGTFADPAWRAGSEVFTLLLDRLERVNPEIRDARAACRSAERIAASGAPWEDPEFELAPSRTVTGGSVWGGEAGVTLTLPLGGHRGRERRLLVARVRAAEENRRAVEKEQAFALRASYVRVLAAQAAVDVARENHRWAEKGTLLARRIAEAGGASAVDVQVVETEERASRLARLEAENDLADERDALAERLLLPPSRFPEFPRLVSSPPKGVPPAREVLLKRLIAESPELARLEAEHRVAGRGLGVELAKRVPDLAFGVAAEWEDGEGLALGLPLGFTLPFWNANREGVAGARAEVAEALEAYRTGLDRAVAALETLSGKLVRLEARRKVLVEEILPSHRKALEKARRALEVSDFDPMQYVELERAHREWQEAAVGLLGEILATRIELETAVGTPLFPLPEVRPVKEKKK
jgi:outer membrane protein TolC